MTSSKKTIVLHALDNSRAFRVTWLLCELGLDRRGTEAGKAPPGRQEGGEGGAGGGHGNEVGGVRVETYQRLQGRKAEPGMAERSGFGLGKSPVLVDVDGLRVVESGNILQYLVEKYGAASSLLPSPPDWKRRTSVFEWLHFSESIMTHALPCIYTRWFVADDSADLAHLAERRMGANVANDLDHVERTLARGTGKRDDVYIASEGHLTIADIALAFSVEYVLAKRPGIDSNRAWPHTEAWLKRLESRDAYRRALHIGARHDFSLLHGAGAGADAGAGAGAAPAAPAQ